MTEFLSTLLMISLYSGIIFGAIMLFRGLFGKKCSASLMAALWLIFVVRLAVPVTIETDLRLIPSSMPSPASHVEERASGLRLGKAPSQAARSIKAGEAPGASTTSSVDPEPVAPPQAPANSSDWSLSITDLALLIYGCGAAICVATKLRMAHALHSRIGGALPASAEVTELAQRIAERMRVRLPKRILSVPGLGTPALTVSLRPALLLPLGMEDGESRRDLKYALMHELTHLKRRDPLVAVLMQVLEVLHWFNPAVWAGFRVMRADVEDACDAAVARTLDSEDRAEYAHMLLRMAADHNALAVLGMAASRPARELARRVRGIMGPRHTSRPMRPAALVLAGMLALTCFTTACQPTPAEQAVSNRDPKRLAEQAGDAQATSASGTHWTDTLDFSPQCVVEIDAIVDDHGMAQVPVAALDRKYFTNEDATRIVKGVFGDLPTYEPVMTKDQIEAEIVCTRQEAQEDEASSRAQWEELLAELEADPEMDAATIEETRLSKEDMIASNRRMFENRVKELESMYDEAPDSEEDLETMEPALRQSGNGSSIALMAFPEGEAATLGLDNAEGMDGGSKLEYRTATSPILSTTWEYENLRPELVPDSASYRTDLNAAEDFVDDIGADHMSLFFVSSTKGEASQVQRAFQFTRKVGEYPELPQSRYDGAASDTSDSAARNTAPLWNRETLRIYVQDGQVVCADWDEPAIADIENENVSVIGFDEAREIALQRLSQRFGAPDSEQTSNKTRTAHITGAELALTKIRTSDQGDWKLVPAWSFTGYFDDELQGGTAQPGELTTFVLVNATDGSVIDGNLMY